MRSRPLPVCAPVAPAHADSARSAEALSSSGDGRRLDATPAGAFDDAFLGQDFSVTAPAFDINGQSTATIKLPCRRQDATEHARARGQFRGTSRQNAPNAKRARGRISFGSTALTLQVQIPPRQREKASTVLCRACRAMTMGMRVFVRGRAKARVRRARRWADPADLALSLTSEPVERCSTSRGRMALALAPEV